MMIDLIDFTALDKNSKDCQRLFHGRGHAYPGLEHVLVDWLPPVVLISLFKAEPNTNLMSWAEQLQDKILESQSVQVQHRYQKGAPFELLLGESIIKCQVSEQGLQFDIALNKTQNTGLFLDMVNGRKWVQQHSSNANVCNLFAYTCAFSVSAISGGAKQVLNVDMSKASLAKGRENHRLNNQDLAKVKFEGVDIFRSFGRLKRHGPYDLLICDPPAFQKGSVDIKKDYQKIIRRLPDLMVDDGWVMLCLNAPDLDEQFLLETVETVCPACQFVEQLATPGVFKEAEKGKGLKVLLFKFKAALMLD